MKNFVIKARNTNKVEAGGNRIFRVETDNITAELAKIRKQGFQILSVK